MRWFKRRRKVREEPRWLIFATEAAAQEWLAEQELATGEPMFISKHTQESGGTYETYRGSDAEVAKTFLMSKSVDRDLYYIVVETPGGNWGMDIKGLYLEALLPWQLDTSTADCEGQIHAVVNIFGFRMAARGVVENYVVKIGCGRCAHIWSDGVRYRDKTMVRCPNCKALTGSTLRLESGGIVECAVCRSPEVGIVKSAPIP